MFYRKETKQEKWRDLPSVIRLMCVCLSLSRVWLFATRWTIAHRLLCLWDSPGKNAGVGCHSLLQGIFPTQGWDPVSLTAGRFFTIWAIREEGPAISSQFKTVKNISDSESGLFSSAWDKFYGRLWKFI